MANLILLDCLLRQVKKIGDQLDGRISFWYHAIVLLTSCINIVIILFLLNKLACLLTKMLQLQKRPGSVASIQGLSAANHYTVR